MGCTLRNFLLGRPISNAGMFGVIFCCSEEPKVLIARRCAAFLPRPQTRAI
jgi:hypothetical protein